MYLNRDSGPFQNYHKAKKLLWDPQDIRYDRDRADWATMTSRENDLLRVALALFLGGEIAVSHDLAPLLIALRREGDHLEEEMFLTAQLFEESKHVEFFADVLEQVVGTMPDLAEIAGASYRAIFHDELPRTLGRLLTDSSRAAQAEAVTTYHMTVEGVLAETGYYGLFAALKQGGLMPGLLRGLELVQRDEARHIAFGLHLLTRFTAEDPAIWDIIEQRVSNLLPLAQGVFMELFEQFLPDIPFGLDVADMISYAEAQYTARMTVLERTRNRR